jgi:hypothetical protein
MKGKYITTQIRLVCAATPSVKKDIHQQIEETIAERKKIILQLTQTAKVINMYLGTTKAA